MPYIGTAIEYKEEITFKWEYLEKREDVQDCYYK